MNIEDAFKASSACDPDYKNWIEEKYPYEVTKDSIFFPGDGSVPEMIVLSKMGKLTACQHIDFGIETDGYHYYENGIWKRVGEKEWQEMYKVHLD